jgi:hypothetical protein
MTCFRELSQNMQGETRGNHKSLSLDTKYSGQDSNHDFKNTKQRHYTTKNVKKCHMDLCVGLNMVMNFQVP